MSRKRSVFENIINRSGLGSLGSFASLMALASLDGGCTSDAISKCTATQSAYCDRVTRCSGTGAADQYRSQCLASLAAVADCNAQTAVADSSDACLAALQLASCDDPLMACTGVLPTVMLPPPPCRIDPSASPSAQAMLLDKCMPGVVSRSTFEGSAIPSVDFLFVIDNSTSMAPKQRVLAASIPQFFQVIDSLNVNYHIGVATTDIGYRASPTMGFPGSNVPTCDTYAGNDGALQVVPCTARTGVTTETTLACGGGTINGVTVPALCPDPSFVPGNSKSYIEVNKSNGTSNVKSYLMGGRELGPQRTFQCIGLVGDGGCGLESPLESARRALDGHRPENAGFLRPGSLLAVVFLTDEEDCSIQLSRRDENEPSTLSSFMSNGVSYSCDTSLALSNGNPSAIDIPGRCYNLDYRCLANNVICDQPMNSVGAKTNCKPKPNASVEPIDTYVSFFSKLRTQDKLVLAGIWAPSLLDSNGSNDGKLVVRPEPGGQTGVAGYNRGYKTEAACYDPSVPISNPSDQAKGYIGGAQLRLSSFIRKFQNRREVSICDSTNYAQAVGNIANLVSQVSAASCLDKPPLVDNGKPQCLVGYVDGAQPSAAPAAALPVCSSSCCAAWAATDKPNPTTPEIVTACTAEAADCYCALPSTRPSICAGGAVVGVWRQGGAQPPSGKLARFACVNQ